MNSSRKKNYFCLFPGKFAELVIDYSLEYMNIWASFINLYMKETKKVLKFSTDFLK